MQRVRDVEPPDSPADDDARGAFAEDDAPATHGRALRGASAMLVSPDWESRRRMIRWAERASQAMREVIWIAGAAVAAMIFYRSFAEHAVPEPPVDEWFRASVVTPSQNRPVIVKFGAKWCGACRAMEPQLSRLEAELGSRVRVVRIDVDEHPDLARHYHVSGIPHSLVFSDGQAVASDIGYLDAQALEKWVEPWLN